MSYQEKFAEDLAAAHLSTEEKALMEEVMHEAVQTVGHVVKVVAIAGGLLVLGAVGAFGYGVYRAFFASNAQC